MDCRSLRDARDVFGHAGMVRLTLDRWVAGDPDIPEDDREDIRQTLVLMAYCFREEFLEHCAWDAAVSAVFDTPFFSEASEGDTPYEALIRGISRHTLKDQTIENFILSHLVSFAKNFWQVFLIAAASNGRMEWLRAPMVCEKQLVW